MTEPRPSDPSRPAYGQEAPYGPPPASPSADASAGARPAGGAGTSAHPGSAGASAHAGAPGAGWSAPGPQVPPPGAAGAYPPPGAAGAYPPGAAGAYPPPGPVPVGAPSYAGPGYWPRNDLGVWSLVLGVAGIVLACGFLTGIPAVILGLRARGAVARGEANNDGVALAGVISGWVAIGLGVVMTVLVVLSFLVPLVVLGFALPWSAAVSGGGY
ncbi:MULTISPECIES: DUF4190 domain-containing protein [Cellulomonas]|uniref:DUF4190 domain-containing protein n=1 Tax=Cellulomonas TaxID=1707 RepID=UPI0010A7AF62|nr:MULTISPECIES: DUF4190 domain-containing protein [Cellulomonas]